MILFGSILFPALAASNSNADALKCAKNLGQLVVALLNHHNARGYFPMASTQPIDHKPASADAQTAAGYSWLASILPYLERRERPGTDLSKNFYATAAFDSELSVLDKGKRVHPATMVIDDFICPSFTRSTRVNAEIPITSHLKTVSSQR